MEKNPLFKGLTRPPMIFGVPMTPFVIAMGSIILVAFYSQNIFLVGFSIPVFFIMKAMTKKDDFIFRLMFLKMRFFSNPASKNYYKAKTYSTNSYRQMPPNSNFPKISVFGLNAEPNFEKLIPFSSLINDSVVITKDYLLMTTWEIGGISFEAEDDDELDIKNDLLNMLFKSFANEPVSFYFHNCRYSIEDKLTSKFNNAFLEEIDRKYYESFKQGTLKKNSLYLTLIFNPLKVKIEKTTFMKSSFENKRKTISVFLAKFSEFADRLEANIKDFNPKRLKTYSKDDKTYSKQLEFYNYLLGGKFNPIRVLPSPIDQYLNGNLQNIQFGHDTIQFNQNDSTKRFARCIEIKDYTNETFAGILDILMYLDVEYTITQSFSPIPRVDAKSAISKQKKQLIATEDDGFSQVEQIDEALDQLTNGEISFGKYHFSILVYGNTIKECKDNTNEVVTKMNELGFGVTLATIALPATFFSQLPSNFAIRPRINLISSINFSSLIALHNFSMGKRDKNCWGDAVSILKTPNKQPYYFNFHQSSGVNKNDFGELFLANTLILGQSSGGKTVFMNFIVDQMMKYASKDTFPDDINLFGIDGTEFLDDKDVSEILSYYILWRVMSLADGRRLCIDIDEAWKWLENEIVQEEVKNKFKTIRKQNGFLRLATQSVEDFLKLKNATTLIEQSATMVFLPNPKAKEEEYVKGVGLSYDEYMIIKGFNVAKRQFLIKRQDEKVICTLDLSSLGNENLKILSTGTAHIDTIEKIFSQENKSLDEKVLELKEFYKNS
ncbi:type IV secretion system protein VirB4 [Campylobacter jejuni]|nr:type IV secretion system protein VirB4 [Campylobacter jejuni]